MAFVNKKGGSAEWHCPPFFYRQLPLLPTGKTIGHCQKSIKTPISTFAFFIKKTAENPSKYWIKLLIRAHDLLISAHSFLIIPLVC